MSAYMLPLGDEDADIKAWLDDLPKGQKAAAVRAAIRRAIGGGDDTLVRVLREVRELRNEVTEMARKVAKLARR